MIFRSRRSPLTNEPGPYWKHHNIHTGEHIGTHLDAPVHWAKRRDGKDVAQIEPARLVGPALVLDVTAEAASDPDFLLDHHHIREWESEHGPLPEGGRLLIRTGRDIRSQDRERFLNKDEQGNPHSPDLQSNAPNGLQKNPGCRCRCNK
ncbi:cyclase family protein [Arthrobacter sp. efr-133-TYG-120]|uniref:cyclase family protein n=1 Tax=Arthrobacter sp. efr-133-TYG-120 TaxID=3040280 RepID=UPI00254CC310|nr:cyclase family protein [Arthrobacter sp. efr-133-TYG-120]